MMKARDEPGYRLIVDKIAAYEAQNIPRLAG